MLEAPLSWEQVQKEAERLSKQYHELVRYILLNQGNSKNWIFKYGGEAWVCPVVEIQTSKPNDVL